MIRTISIKNFDNRLKTLETKMLKKYGKSKTWVSFYNDFKKCILEVEENTVTIDEKVYKEKRKEILGE